MNDYTRVFAVSLRMTPAEVPHDMRRTKGRIDMPVITGLIVVSRSVYRVVLNPGVGHYSSSGIKASRPIFFRVWLAEVVIEQSNS